MSTTYIKTLRYWFDVEALMYPDIPKSNPKKGRPAYVQCYEDQLPWHRPPYVNTPDSHKFFVYFGLVNKKILEKELMELFQVADEGESYSGNHTRDAQGKTFLCAIEVNSNGFPVAGTLQLAAYAVSFSERKNKKRLGFSTVVDSLKAKINNLLADIQDESVTGSWFKEVIDFLVVELNWSPRQLLAPHQISVHALPLRNKDGKPISPPPELEPINSFYLADIEKILKAAESGTESAQINKYFEAEQPTDIRHDVTQPDVFNRLLAAKRFPLGRWPSEFPLFLMQQVAVNTAMHELKDGGVFSINGPPGTGKTTLLMDVIAARIVERAEILASFVNPSEAFKRSKEKVSYPSGKEGSFYFLDSRLLDFGIVVASANNNAVENITRDLPNIEKVFPHPLSLNGKPFDYFSSIAESIINHEVDKRERMSARNTVAIAEAGDTEEDSHERSSPEILNRVKCWGLISAPLGKRTNCNLVAGKLGKFGNDGGLAGILEVVPSDELNWDEACKQFREATAEVRAIQDDIEKYEKCLPKLTKARDALVNVQAWEVNALDSYNRAKNEHDLKKAQLADSERAFDRTTNARTLLNQDWSNWRQLINFIFDRDKYNDFRLKQQALADENEDLRKLLGTLKRDCLQAAHTATKMETEWQDAQSSLSAAIKEVNRIEKTVASLKSILGEATFHIASFCALSIELQQKSLPRTNVQYHHARGKVLVAALHLHKSFMKQAGKPFEANFRLALSMLQEMSFTEKLMPQMAPHFWATFFLAVPVVSSTFASFPRCFGHLGEGQIGLLLIDEAGQAVPSNALGAIWRSKRALLVGDPLQVEPVIKMDRKLDYEILKYHDAPERHLLTEYSAQHLADRGNMHGSCVARYDGVNLWVGSPLRVHRRCADPMFSLSNAVAYNDKMVFGLNHNDELVATISRPLYGRSRWIDQSNDDFEDHFSMAEGLLATDIVAQYYKEGWLHKDDGLPDIFVISPFKTAAEGLQNLLRERVSEWAPNIEDDALNNWLKGHVGTVHTFQGKECESVIFVLGGKTGGAIKWAATSPNIINVAVTRAKRRLYVIGNRKKWRDYTFGRKMADVLTVDADDIDLTKNMASRISSSNNSTSRIPDYLT